MYFIMAKKTKTIEERKREVDTIMVKIMELGLSHETPSISKLIIISEDFVYNGISASGVLSLPEYHRTIKYKFSMQSHIQSTVELEHFKIIK